MRRDPASTPREQVFGPQERTVCVSRGLAHGFWFALPWALVLWALIVIAVIVLA